MSIPLSERMRPKNLNDIIGQSHIVGYNKPINNMIKTGYITNMIFYGPPGTGKTTTAQIIASESKIPIRILNGATASSSDIKEIITESQSIVSSNGILLYLDEIQYLNKKQQQPLLEAIEKGFITLIASTTENPGFYIYGSLLSRCVVFEFKTIKENDIKSILKKALDFLKNETKEEIVFPEKYINHISIFCSGDVRKAINTVEMCVIASPLVNNKKIISDDIIKTVTRKNSIYCNNKNDMHYDLLSAFQKSMRGSDPNAAVYYMSRLLDSDNLISVCRRLMVCACEDVGLAYPQIIPIVKSCVDIALQTGMPEARIPLADAVILVSISPKSNSAYVAVNKAFDDINLGETKSIPEYLKNTHINSINYDDKTKNYMYPHDYTFHWINQIYMPEGMNHKNYYEYGNNKNEQSFKIYWDKIKGLQS